MQAPRPFLINSHSIWMTLKWIVTFPLRVILSLPVNQTLLPRAFVVSLYRTYPGTPRSSLCCFIIAFMFSLQCFFCAWHNHFSFFPLLLNLLSQETKYPLRKSMRVNWTLKLLPLYFPDAWTLIYFYRLQHWKTSFTGWSSFLKQGKMQAAFQFEFRVLQKCRLAMFYLICPLVPRISVMKIWSSSDSFWCVYCC